MSTTQDAPDRALAAAGVVGIRPINLSCRHWLGLLCGANCCTYPRADLRRSGPSCDWEHFQKFKIEPIYYNVNAARKMVFPDFKALREGNSVKHEVWRRVMKMEPQINWKYGPKSKKLLDVNYDMVDAYVIAVCDILTVSAGLMAAPAITEYPNEAKMRLPKIAPGIIYCLTLFISCSQ